MRMNDKLAAVLRFSTVAILGTDAAVIGFRSKMLAQEFASTGFTEAQAPAIATILTIAVVLYAIPGTALIGAILVTGFLGGAICAHFRIGELGSPPQIICLLLGAIAWGGIVARCSIRTSPKQNAPADTDKAAQDLKVT